MAMAQGLLDKGPGVAVDMGGACLRYSLDLVGHACLGYDFKVGPMHPPPRGRVGRFEGAAGKCVVGKDGGEDC